MKTTLCIKDLIAKCIADHQNSHEYEILPISMQFGFFFFLDLPPSIVKCQSVTAFTYPFSFILPLYIHLARGVCLCVCVCGCVTRLSSTLPACLTSKEKENLQIIHYLGMNGI